jgi:hypothetical protein
MKRQIKYRVATIANKLSLDLLVIVDTNQRFGNPEFVSENDGTKFISLNIMPLIKITILRTSERNDDGGWQRAPYNPSDGLAMTRYTYPIFTLELERMNEAMRIPELYSYVNKQLQLNDALAEKHRRVFQTGRTVIEMVPIVIVQPDDETRVEGIRLKFNNEQSSVSLTLNDIESLLFTLKTMNVDSLTTLLYTSYLKDDIFYKSGEGDSNPTSSSSVDIRPKGDRA